jgi:outer membrane receptor protein involved in Fe transport
VAVARALLQGRTFTAAGAPRTGNATGFENLLLGRPQRINFALGNPVINTKQDDYFFFVQDDYRVRPNLTLNLGLRYELSTTPFNPIIEALNTREADPNRSIFGTSFPLSTRTATKLRLDKITLRHASVSPINRTSIS